jgi:ApeA N-terminal domain 1
MNGQQWLSERAEWSGRWWLPDDPETVIAGVLRYEPGAGSTLSLVGGFSERNLVEIEGGWRDVETPSLRWPVLQGYASGKRVTLLDCAPVASVSRGFLGTLLQGPDEQQISVTSALIGVHIDRADEEVFTRCEVARISAVNQSSD